MLFPHLLVFLLVIHATRGAPSDGARDSYDASSSEPDLSEVISSDASDDESGNDPSSMTRALSPKNHDPESSSARPAFYTFFNMFYPKTRKFDKIIHDPGLDYSKYPLNAYEDIHEFYQMRKYRRAYDLWNNIGQVDQINVEANNDDARQDAMNHLMRMHDRGGGAFFSTAHRGIALNEKKSVESAMADHFNGDLPVLRKSSKTNRLTFTFPGQEHHFDPGNAESGYGSAEPDYENGYDSDGAVWLQ